MKKMLYVAYGSNLNKEQMQHRCPEAEIAGIGVLPNYRLEFRRVLTVVPCPSSSVPVAVWKISVKDESNLDLYEGYPISYRKEHLHIDFADGTNCSAMAYLMNGGYLTQPSMAYQNVVEQGYRDFNLDMKYLTDALKRSRKKVTSGSEKER